MKGSWNVIKEYAHSIADGRDINYASGPLPATDSWNMATLIYEIFNGQFTSADQLNKKGKIPQVLPSASIWRGRFSSVSLILAEKDIFAAYKRLLNPGSKARISVSQFLDLGSRAGGFFSTDLIKCSEALENMSIKGDHEREIFLQYLHSQTHLTPHSVIVRYA